MEAPSTAAHDLMDEKAGGRVGRAQCSGPAHPGRRATVVHHGGVTRASRAMAWRQGVAHQVVTFPSRACETDRRARTRDRPMSAEPRRHAPGPLAPVAGPRASGSSPAVGLWPRRRFAETRTGAKTEDHKEENRAIPSSSFPSFRCFAPFSFFSSRGCAESQRGEGEGSKEAKKKRQPSLLLGEFAAALQPVGGQVPSRERGPSCLLLWSHHTPTAYRVSFFLKKFFLRKTKNG